MGKDIEIGDTMEFHTKLILSPTAKNQVGMCVHKARRDQSSLCIYPFSIYVGRGASPNLKKSVRLLAAPTHLFLDLDGALSCPAFGSVSQRSGKNADVEEQHSFHMIVRSFLKREETHMRLLPSKMDGNAYLMTL